LVAKIPYITLYDIKGELKKNSKILKERVEEACKEILGEKWASEIILQWTVVDFAKDSVSNVSQHPAVADEQCRAHHIKIMSFDDGKPQIATVAKQICMTAKENQANSEFQVSNEIIKNNLSGQGNWNPDIVVNFHSSQTLCGFLPWHVSISEIIHLGSLQNITILYFLYALTTYSLCEQRHGK